MTTENHCQYLGIRVTTPATCLFFKSCLWRCDEWQQWFDWERYHINDNVDWSKDHETRSVYVDVKSCGNRIQAHIQRRKKAQTLTTSISISISSLHCIVLLDWCLLSMFGTCLELFASYFLSLVLVSASLDLACPQPRTRTRTRTVIIIKIF